MLLENKLKVLSLFDGISVAHQALHELGYECNYYSSETDKYSIQIAQKNFPDTIQLGDIVKLGRETPYPLQLKQGVDLIIFGSPCQDLSLMKLNRQGLSGKKSGLFYEAIRIMRDIKHTYFVIENVASMTRRQCELITSAVLEFIEPSKKIFFNPLTIDAKLFSAQKRKRLWWTNIKGITIPIDNGIFLKNVIHESRRDADVSNFIISDKNLEYINKTIAKRFVKIVDIDSNEKSRCMLSRQYSDWRGTFIRSKDYIRQLTPVECERLQCLPDNYTNGISERQRYKSLGNAFNCGVVKHILKFMTPTKKIMD